MTKEEMTHVWVVRYYWDSEYRPSVIELHKTMTKEKFAKLAKVDVKYVTGGDLGLYVDCTFLPNYEEHLDNSGYDIVEAEKEELHD